MLSFQNCQQKDDFMGNLKYLKDNEKFKGLRITENFSYEERKVYRDKIKEAKLLNDNESDITKWHKVMGDPRRGMEIKIVKRKSPNHD